MQVSRIDLQTGTLTSYTTTGGESLSYMSGMEKIGDSLFASSTSSIYEIELSGTSATVSKLSLSGIDNSTSLNFHRMASTGNSLYLSGTSSNRPMYQVNLVEGGNGETTGEVTQIEPSFTAASYYNTGKVVKLSYIGGLASDGTALYVAGGQSRLIQKISVKPQETFIVTVSAASGNNRFALDGEEISAKTLVRGATYRFMQTDTTNNGQPFYIATTNTGAGADAYGTGWAYEGTAGNGGIGLFTVPENAPDTLYYQSETQAGMGAVLTIEDTPSRSVTIAGRLTNTGQVELPGSTLTLQNGADLTGGDLNLGDGKLVLEGSLTKTGGTVTTTEASLKLEDNISITSNDGLIFKDLDLNNSALTLGSATSKLTVSNAVTLDNSSEKINAGSADLTLSGGMSLSSGNISANGGIISLGNTSTVATDGMLDVSNSTLELSAGLSVAGTIKTDNATTLTLNNNALDLSGGQAAAGGVLETSGLLTLDGITFDEKSSIKLNANTLLNSATPISVKTVDMGTYSLALGSETTDLTIADNLTIDSGSGGGIGSGLADLTLNGPVTVSSGGISSSGGTLTFGPDSGDTSFVQYTGVLLSDTALVLKTNININYLELKGSSVIQTNGNTLSPSYLTIGTDSELNLTNATFNETELQLLGDSSITSTVDLILGSVLMDGFSLTLNQNIPSLKAESIWLTNHWNSGSSRYMSNTGVFTAQGVDVTLTKPFQVVAGKLKMGGGTLTLEQGGEIRDGGELDLSNSVLELSGPFYNHKATGTLTTSSSKLRLKSNVKFEPGNNAAFATYEPNGWGMVLHNDSDNSSQTINLTLGTNGVDLILEPNTASRTSGFVNYYSSQNGAVLSGDNHVIGIETHG
ncbi:MAG: hypothetical protein QF535_08820, partial [Anaerolineales bacterium]|nr:hypothetical protein [Anaerolineales bacterium]